MQSTAALHDVQHDYFSISIVSACGLNLRLSGASEAAGAGGGELQLLKADGCRHKQIKRAAKAN